MTNNEGQKTHAQQVDNKVAEYLARAVEISIIIQTGAQQSMPLSSVTEIAKMIQIQEIHEDKKLTND